MSCKKLISCQSYAPGKVILHGEHSVVYGKTAIAASLGLKTASTITECPMSDEEPCIHLNFPNIQLKDLQFHYKNIYNHIISKIKNMDFAWNTPESMRHEEVLRIVEEYFEHYQKTNEFSFTKSQKQAVTIFLYLYCAVMGKIECVFNSFTMTIITNLTIGSGIGSSASFAVSLSAVLYQYARLKSSGVIDSKIEDSDRSIISGWAFCCEKISHGNPSGIDNTVCTYGSLVEFKKGFPPKMHKLNTDFKICLVHTRVERNTKSYVEKVALLKSRYPEVIDNIMEAIDSLTVTALDVILRLHNEGDASKKHEFFIKMTELFEINHGLLRTLDVSHQTLEKISSISKELGFGSKLTGAGGGGFAIILIPPYKTDEEIEKLMDDLKACNFDTQLTILGGDGVSITTKYI